MVDLHEEHVREDGKVEIPESCSGHGTRRGQAGHTHVGTVLTATSRLCAAALLTSPVDGQMV